MPRRLLAVVVVLVLAGSAVFLATRSSGAGLRSGRSVLSCVMNAPALNVPSTDAADLDSIAQEASGTAMSVDSTTGNRISIVVEPTSAQAQDVESTYRTWTIALGGHVERDGNVVVAYLSATDAEKSALSHCV